MSMGTVAGAGRGGRRRRRPMAEINMTPLVDVMLVLLVIFMLTAPAMKREGINVELPKAKGGTGLGKTTTALTISVDAERMVSVGDERMPLNDIEARLPAFLKGKEKETLTLRAHSALSHGEVMRVMGVIRAAGVTGINIAVEGVKK